jgi:hypothetical protein
VETGLLTVGLWIVQSRKPLDMTLEERKTNSRHLYIHLEKVSNEHQSEKMPPFSRTCVHPKEKGSWGWQGREGMLLS